jgi:hypothetical protein
LQSGNSFAARTGDRAKTLHPLGRKQKTGEHQRTGDSFEKEHFNGRTENGFEKEHFKEEEQWNVHGIV